MRYVLTMMLLSGLSFAGVGRFSARHVVKPAAKVSYKAVKVSAKVAKKSAKVAYKAAY